jgi:hypothetical protein
VDLLETADRGAVEADALLEQGLRQFAHRDAEVLPGPGQVREANVNEFDACLFGPGDDVLRRSGGG